MTNDHNHELTTETHGAFTVVRLDDCRVGVVLTTRTYRSGTERVWFTPFTRDGLPIDYGHFVHDLDWDYLQGCRRARLDEAVRALASCPDDHTVLCSHEHPTT